MLAIDELSVDFDIKNAATAFDELGVDTGRFLDCIRQTGGLRRVVSLNTVSNGYLHQSPPFIEHLANDLAFS